MLRRWRLRTLATLALTLAPLAPVVASRAARAEEEAASVELTRVDEAIAQLQRVLGERFGITRIYLAGGAAVSALDHAARGRPLAVRDLDVFIDLGRTVTQDFANAVSIALEGERVGRRLKDQVSTKLRARPPGDPERRPPGYGFLLDRGGLELDVSLYHSLAELRLNGILDTERVLVPLTAGTSLAATLARIARTPGGYDAWLAQGLVVDPERGYASWTAGEPRLVNWNEVASDPLTSGLRVIRGRAKVGAFQVDDATVQRFRDLIAGRRLRRLRPLGALLKVLGDAPPKAVRELREAERLTVLEAISSPLAVRIAREDDAALERRLAAPRAGELATALYTPRGAAVFASFLADLAPAAAADLFGLWRSVDPQAARAGGRWAPLRAVLERARCSDARSQRPESDD
jgi:hypothetical protein